MSDFSHFGFPANSLAIEYRAHHHAEAIGKPNDRVILSKPNNDTPQKSFWDPGRNLSLAEALIPVYGSGRQAIKNFKDGEYLWCVFNTAMAISDLFLVKAIVVSAGRIVTKTAFKKGSTKWRAVRDWLRKQGLAEKGQHFHHWLLAQGGKGELTLKGFFNYQYGRFIPTALKNQPWNLMPMPNQAFHTMLHQKGLVPFMKKLHYGTPSWSKAVVNYGLSRRIYQVEKQLYNGEE